MHVFVPQEEREVKVITKDRCPACGGSGEIEFTNPTVLMGTGIMHYAREVLKEVANAHGLKVGDVIGPSRAQHLALARFDAAQRMRDELSMTLESIGVVLGGRDHSTIINMLRRARGETPAEIKSR